MTTKNGLATVARAALPVLALPVLALALGACVVRPSDARDDPYHGTIAVLERDRPERYHFYDATDAANVHYYEAQRPDEIVTRRVLREPDGRTYYAEREGATDIRFFFDESTARAHGRDRDDQAAAMQRTHYYERWDTANVYYFQTARPDVVVTRRVLREPDGRTYYVEQDRGAERRTYFDDSAARANGRDRDDRVTATQRTHYYERWDKANVYYFETTHPDVVVNRRIFREQDGRTYYVERDGAADRRFYYDDAAARISGQTRDRDHN